LELHTKWDRHVASVIVIDDASAIVIADDRSSTASRWA
jgi:hypothetical protein